MQEGKELFLIERYLIGVGVYPNHGLNYETLRRAADTAMYRIKADTKGGAALFNSEMGGMTVHMAQEQRLRLAVRDGHLCCAFQPKVDMRTVEVAGVEALIRLRDADGVTCAGRIAQLQPQPQLQPRAQPPQQSQPQAQTTSLDPNRFKLLRWPLDPAAPDPSRRYPSPRRVSASLRQHLDSGSGSQARSLARRR